MPLQTYAKTVASIFDAVLDERLTTAALRAVADYVGASGAAYFLVNKLTGQVGSLDFWGSFSGDRADYLAHYSKIDPFRLIQQEAECGRLARLSERLPQGVLRQDEWYNDYVLKGGVCDVLGTKLYESPSRMVIVGLHRAIADRPVPGDTEALERLMAPLASAARLHAGLIDIGYRSAIARGRLGDLAAGVIFTDLNGRIVEVNQTGERILRLGDGLKMHNGQVAARRSFETSKLASLIAAASSVGGPSAGCMLISRDGGQPSYVIRVAPVGTQAAGYELPMAMILISAPGENRVSERELAELYGLSPAESRLAIALAEGKNLAELARQFSVQITTLRTQLSSVLEKCEVKRQVDLVLLIASIPVVRPEPINAELVE
jgi:DNA-binding CsgD family transcriptional regulator